MLSVLDGTWPLQPKPMLKNTTPQPVARTNRFNIILFALRLKARVPAAAIQVKRAPGVVAHALRRAGHARALDEHVAIGAPVKEERAFARVRNGDAAEGDTARPALTLHVNAVVGRTDELEVA